MMQRAFLGFLTVIMFLAGYMSRLWTERSRPVPPPPIALTTEYPVPALIDRAKLIAEIEKLRPQIEAYLTRVDEIYADFDRQFATILTPKQREKHTLNLKRWAEHNAKQKADRTPPSDIELIRARERSGTDVIRMCTVTANLVRFTKEYELDANQQSATRDLLTIRSNRFIALLDGTPHPSIRLSQLPPLIDRVMKSQTASAAKPSN